MPLTPFQVRLLSLLAENRTKESYIAGATGIHMSTSSPRRSADLDLFHDQEQAVAEAYEADRRILQKAGLRLSIEISQPGFIRAIVSGGPSEELRVDWAHDSMWRFLPPIQLEGTGFVLHPVDLAVNKALALAGRDEPRDFVDILYLHEKVLPLGTLCWAACGKDPGVNPEMLLELLARRGRYRQADFDRLDLSMRFDAAEQVARYRQALDSGRGWIASRPPDEAGCLYRRPGTGLFFAPKPDEDANPHFGAPGGVVPTLSERKSFFDQPEVRSQLESFYERRLLKD